MKTPNIKRVIATEDFYVGHPVVVKDGKAYPAQVSDIGPEMLQVMDTFVKKGETANLSGPHTVLYIQDDEEGKNENQP